MENIIEITDLHVSIDGQEILKGLNLVVKPGEVHAIMGPNGAGKSTLAKVIANHPAYEITKGDIKFKGESILELDPDERCHLGIFMSFQYPLEIEGVTNFEFLKSVYNSHLKFQQKDEINDLQFDQVLVPILAKMNINRQFVERDLNSGFSGGEKKRNEILQMAVINPTLSILDETDSGLDIDALRIVSEGINMLMTKDKGLILITHYQRLLDYITPHFVHVMVDGQIVKSGDSTLALELEKNGYQHMEKAIHAN
ncbi:MAG: Fe-S cluster assembly ATPase SufC [Rhabdochlamydiaceae bacterium]|nr:Fe-S cluster assembly ATPase SufC [Candidatus Amphrikana amoebophyrae]